VRSPSAFAVVVRSLFCFGPWQEPNDNIITPSNTLSTVSCVLLHQARQPPLKNLAAKTNTPNAGCKREYRQSRSTSRSALSDYTVSQNTEHRSQLSSVTRQLDCSGHVLPDKHDHRMAADAALFADAVHLLMSLCLCVCVGGGGHIQFPHACATGQ